jgi:hypothetical protein
LFPLSTKEKAITVVILLLQVRELNKSNGSHSMAAAYGGREKYTHETLQETCLEEEKGAGDGTETSSAAEGEREDGKFLCRGRQI